MMNDTPFLAECLATFSALSETVKLTVLLMPPGFALGVFALILHHRRVIRRLSLSALPGVLDNIEERELFRRRLCKAEDLLLLEAFDALNEAVDRAGDPNR